MLLHIVVSGCNVRAFFLIIGFFLIFFWIVVKSAMNPLLSCMARVVCSVFVIEEF